MSYLEASRAPIYTIFSFFVCDTLGFGQGASRLSSDTTDFQEVGSWV